MAGVYELKSNDRGEFSFVLKAANGLVVLRSQQYASKATAMSGIASVQSNSASADRYEKLVASDGRHYFNLKAGNQQVVGTSQMYATPSARDEGIASVMANGPGSAVTEPAA
ncbi:MAG: YegP family protein [Rubrivivax sp.]